jgi:hypothetical protein
MTDALVARNRAYSDDDVSTLHSLFELSGLSESGEVLCAVEISKWKAQRELIKKDLVQLDSSPNT